LETAVGAPLNTTYWGLLKQPDKQKPPTYIVSTLSTVGPRGYLPVTRQQHNPGHSVDTNVPVINRHRLPTLSEQQGVME
jgi:hypothetical protein